MNNLLTLFRPFYDIQVMLFNYSIVLFFLINICSITLSFFFLNGKIDEWFNKYFGAGKL